MRVLISAASKYGATTQIGQAIADVLVEAGHTTTVLDPDSVTSLDHYDAAVLGSAVYAGRWLKPAKELIEHLGEDLAKIPVWMFSSGPIGDPPKPDEPAADAISFLELIQAREHRVFAGRLDKSQLNFAERAIVKAFGAPEGDFRDWSEVKGWAEEIAVALAPAGSIN